MTSASGTSRSNRKKKDQQKFDALIEEEVISSLMKHARGRRWLWLQLSSMGVYQAAQSLEHPTMCYQEGMRNQGLRLQSMILRHASIAYVEMLRENTKLEQLLREQEKEESDGRTEPGE